MKTGTARFWPAIVSALLAAAVLSVSTPTLASEIDRFVGEYLGEGISQADGELNTRDLKVEIRKKNDGFVVDWVSVIRTGGGEIKRKAYSVYFEPSGKPGIYGSAMRTDMFGHRVPMDPLKGDPYVWARVTGGTLFVYALLITDAGGYEVQTYERTLIPEGMSLRYSRVRDGQVLRTVEGTLRRVD